MRPAFIVYFCLLLLLTACPAAARPAQVQADTVKQKAVVEKDGLEGPIEYEALVFDNLVAEGKTILTGEAVVSYLDMVLRAARITVDWEAGTLTAEGVKDTVWKADPESGDSVRTEIVRGEPEFRDAGDVIAGERMVYNFKTKKGRVLRGRTTFETAYYSGKVIKMAGSKTAYIGDVHFTTCESEDPHFHFAAKQMRVDINKSVAARPLVMYLGNIPVLAAPFLYFPIKKGRRSGVLLPRYGQSTLEGNYLKGFGYYWAASDYWDAKGTVDYYEKSGFLFRGDVNYHLRYKMRGSVSGSWTRKDFETSGLKERRWDLVLRHAQTLSPTMRLSANGTFVSSKDIYRQLSANRNQRMQSQIRSNATLTKQWGGSRSMTVNLSRIQDLRTDEYTETLPRINLRGGRSALFPKKEGPDKRAAEPKWFNNIYISYNSNIEARKKSTLSVTGGDSSYTVDSNLGWDHDVRLNSPQKLFRWFTVSPNLNYQETWQKSRLLHRWNADSARVEQEQEDGFFARRTYDMSVSLGTKLYGVFRPRVFPETLVRHVVTPNLGYTYQPDFSAANFEYYDAVKDTAGNVTWYDRYGNTMFSRTPRGGRRSLSFSVQNLFQVKSGLGEREKKFDLFTWNISTSYNWKAEQFKLGNIASSVRANPLKNVSMNINAVHSAYKTDAGGQPVDSYYADDMSLRDFSSIVDGRLLRMVNFSADVRMSFKGTAGTKAAGPAPDTTSVETADDGNPLPGDRFNMEADAGSTAMPWQLTASLRYSDSRYNPANPSKQFWLNADLQFNLTKNWRISWNGRVDLLDRDMVSQDLSIYRDMHCWEASFAWTPTGLYKRFYLRVNIKASILKDVKFEHGTGRRGFSGSSFQNTFY